MRIRSLFLASTLLTGCVSVDSQNSSDEEMNTFATPRAREVESKEVEPVRVPIEFVENSNILCSDETRAHFGEGLMEGFKKLAGANGLKTLLMICPEDIFEDDAHKKMEEDEYQNFLKEKAAEFAEQYPDVPKELIERGFSQNNNKNLLRAMCFDQDLDGDKNSDVALIFITSRAEKKERWLKSHSKATPEELLLIPGTDLDWQVMTVAHEIGHGSLAKSSDGFFHCSEIEADQNAVDFMTYAFEQGIVSDPDVGTAFVRIRALRTVNRMFGARDRFIGFSHDTSAGVQTIDEYTAPVANSDKPFKDALKFLEGEVLFHAGMQYLSKNKTFTDKFSEAALYRAETPWTAIAKKLNQLVERGQEEFAEKVALIFTNLSLGVLPADEAVGKIIDLETEYAVPSHDQMSFAVLQGVEYLGVFVSLSDEQKFDFLKDLYVDGAFDENQIAKQFVYEYLRAAIDYVPVTFGVEDRYEYLEQPIFTSGHATTPSTRQDKTYEALFEMPGR